MKSGKQKKKKKGKTKEKKPKHQKTHRTKKKQQKTRKLNILDSYTFMFHLYQFLLKRALQPDFNSCVTDGRTYPLLEMRERIYQLQEQ